MLPGSDILRQGGGVLWIIMGCGILAFCVFVERALHLHRARIRGEDFVRGIINNVKRGNIKEALTICDETPGPVAYIIKTALLHRNDPRADLREAIRDASLAEVSRMERRLVIIATVAQIAPLLGLLGTAIGMLESVIVMQIQAPLIYSADILGGLLKALVTTAGGLSVAIPCYAAFNLLAVKIERIVLDMERAASDFVAFMSQEGIAKEGAGNDSGPNRGGTA